MSDYCTTHFFVSWYALPVSVFVVWNLVAEIGRVAARVRECTGCYLFFFFLFLLLIRVAMPRIEDACTTKVCQTFFFSPFGPERDALR
jgi:hypothetical protein